MSFSRNLCTCLLYTSDAFTSSVLFSILGECALALESLRNAEEKEKAAVLAKNEQLRANLLRSISHDLRTPLTSISGNADTLLHSYNAVSYTHLFRVFSLFRLINSASQNHAATSVNRKQQRPPRA